jgi:hypothetical protein
MAPNRSFTSEPDLTGSAGVEGASGREVAGNGCCPGEIQDGTGRRIGPWGTATRLVAGAGGVAWGLAVPHHHPLFDLPLAGSRLWGALAGVVVLPVLMTLLIALRGRSAPPLRLGHGAACLVTVGVVVLVQVFPVAILTWIGSTLLLLAVLGRGGCEVLAAPNLLLRRSDYLACLPFTPIDAWEARRAGGR